MIGQPRAREARRGGQSNLVNMEQLNTFLHQRGSHKSRLAFLWNVDNMFDNSEHVYFWTFTFREVVSDHFASCALNSLLVRLKYHHGPLLWGVRVTELHKTHGVHYHMLVNYRMSVDLVRRIASRYGFGRIHVVQCKDRQQGYYLAKYLTKEHRLSTGARAWASFGRGPCITVKGVESDTPFSRVWKGLGMEGSSTRKYFYIISACCQIWGGWESWPSVLKRQARFAVEQDGESLQFLPSFAMQLVRNMGMMPKRSQRRIYELDSKPKKLSRDNKEGSN